MRISIYLLAAGALALGATASLAGANQCEARSGPQRMAVLELYTSEGCSSCPPADRWLSTLKGNPGAVVQAFHVGYWDYIGWVDRFANAAHTSRQRQVAALNQQTSIYTPQAVLDGRDWRNWGTLPLARASAEAGIMLKEVGPDQFEASVTPGASAPSLWAAYWTVTEDGHSSRVKAGENAGEFLLHDFVVRQYTPVGEYRVSPGGEQKLLIRSIASTPGHQRRINLVVFDPRSGRTLQALSLAC